MNNQMAQLQEATIKAQCKALRMPMIGSQFCSMAEQAIREKKSHIGYLEALLLVSDKEQTFLLSGQGDVIEPDGGIAAIGSGGPYAQAAAQALAEHTELTAHQIAEEAMKIASKMCIYTNDRITIEEL